MQRLKSYKRQLIASAASLEFKHFYNQVWAQAIIKSDCAFIPSDHIDRWCDELQEHSFTSKESARLHSKSEILHAFGPWQFFRKIKSLEILYFSYKQDLAVYQTRKIKDAMLQIPEFSALDWLSPADSVIHCRWPGTQITLRILPFGIRGAKRGMHPDGVICDDILKDSIQRKINIEEMKEISRVFEEEIMSMPKQGGFLHCWGTSQDPTDLFNQNKKRPGFYCKTEPAIYVEGGVKKALWPGKFPLEELARIQADMSSAKAFNKEYLCMPVRGEEGYFSHAELDAVVDYDMKEIDPDDFETEDEIYGGFDIGKKRHPSHLVLFRNHKGKLVQLISKWMEGWDYSEQIEYLTALCEKISVLCLRYDNTRSEFESYAEKGNLPDCMEPVSFTVKSKNEMAALLESRIRANPEPTIVLLPDTRQKNQILSVDNDLHAPETPEGHGDAFWSCGLACDAADSGGASYIN